MKFEINRETFLKPLNQVFGAVEKKQTMPALANLLIKASNNELVITATDLEIELVASIQTAIDTEGETTIPARKLLDIVKALPEESNIKLEVTNERATIRSGKSRFTLSTLTAADFPSLDEINNSKTFQLAQKDLKRMIDKTAFAMANQDVRYYLNGLMLEVSSNQIRSVATDGHRLALSTLKASVDTESQQQIIVPRKGVMELGRLLEQSDEQASIQISANHIRVSLPDLRFTSKLIDGRFPDYNRVIPQGGDMEMLVNCAAFRQSLQRASILSNEKYRGIRLTFNSDLLKIQAHNPEQEEAEEELQVQYNGSDMEIGFNVNYLVDVLNNVSGDDVSVIFKDSNSSALMKEVGSDEVLYVVMPMRL